MGVVTEAVKRYVPATYNQMLLAEANTRLFATSDLQALADYVKYRLFGTAVDESLESVLYDPHTTQFLGKLTTLQFIPAAVDYWDSQLSSIVATGTGEVQNFRDHQAGLIKLWEILTKDVLKEAAILGFSLARHGLLPSITYGDNGRGILITPDPECFPPIRRRERITIPWSMP